MPSKPPPKIKLFVKYYCGWCHEAKDYLDQLGWPYEEVEVARNPAGLQELERLSGQTMAPTAVIGDKLLVDFGQDELEDFLKKEGYL